MTADAQQITAGSRARVDTPPERAPATASARGGLRPRMPRWLRVTLTLLIFGSFFTVSTVVGIVALPLLLVARRDRRERRRRRLNLGLRWFAGILRRLRMLDYELPVLPAELEGRSFLMVANHPTFLDVVLLLGSVPELTCVVKASWYRSVLLGPMLRVADYVPGPGIADDGSPEAPVLSRIEQKLRGGTPVLVFPEGTRSPWRDVRRFRRGALEAALRAGVPVQPVLITVDRPFLRKGQRPWDVPDDHPRYAFEWLETVDTRAATSSRTLARELRGRYRARLQQMEDPCASA